MQMNLPRLTANTFESYLASIQQIPILSLEEEIELAKRYQLNNDLQAAYTLIMSNLRMVVYLAREYQGYGLALDELVQEGNVGLMKAVKKYDPEQGVRLASYAVHWIRAEILEFISRNWKIVRSVTTKAQRKLFFGMRKFIREGNSYSDVEISNIAETLDVPEYEVKTMERRLYSHDTHIVHHDDDDEFGGLNHNELVAHNSDPLHHLIAHESHVDMDELLSHLSERERDIIQSRWLDDDKATLDTLSIKYKVSIERIRQIEESALKKIRMAFA